MTTTPAPRAFTKADTRRVFCPGFYLWTVTVSHEAGTITPTTEIVAADNEDSARAVARYRVAEARRITATHLRGKAVCLGRNPEADAWEAAANS